MYVDDLLIVSESEAAEMAVREAISARLTLKIHRHDQPFRVTEGPLQIIQQNIQNSVCES